MEQKSTVILSIGLISLCLVLGGSVLAQSDRGGPASVTVSLAGSSTVCSGEPILLKYFITNSSGLPITISTKDTIDDALSTETFTEVGGKPLVPSANLLVPRHKSQTFTMDTGVDVAGNSSRSWEGLANTHITILHPGSYVLRVHVERPYGMGEREQVQRGQGEHFVLSGDYVFPLKVVAANPAYLQSLAERLRKSIVTTTDAPAKLTLIQALFSIPEADAVSSWKTLVEEPKLDGEALNEIGTALEALQTTKAADLLAEMFWNPAQSPDALAEASIFQHFYGMYDAGTPEIKQHIEDLHQQHGVVIPRFRLE